MLSRFELRRVAHRVVAALTWASVAAGGVTGSAPARGGAYGFRFGSETSIATLASGLLAWLKCLMNQSAIARADNGGDVSCVRSPPTGLAFGPLPYVYFPTPIRRTCVPGPAATAGSLHTSA